MTSYQSSNGSPSEIVRRNIGYKIIQRLTNSTGDGFTITLNPTAFDYSGMCKVYLRSIAIRDFTAGNALFTVEVNLSQPYSQSNIHTANPPNWNPANEIYWAQIDTAATSYNDTDLVGTFIYSPLSGSSNITVRLHNAAGSNLAGNYVGILIWEIVPC